MGFTSFSSVFTKNERNEYISYQKTFVELAAFFTIGKEWKQLKCPPVEEYRENVVYHTMEYY